MKHSNEQATTRKETQSTPTENIKNADTNTVQQKNEDWRKGTTLILGDLTISGLIEEKMSRNRKIKVRYFPEAKINDIYHYAIFLLEKKPETIILHFGINDTPSKSGTNILKDLIELENVILEKLPSSKKKHFCHVLRTDKESAKKNNDIFTNRLEEQGIPYITHNNIVHNHLHQDGLHLNSAGFSILAENFLSYILRK